MGASVFSSISMRLWRDDGRVMAGLSDAVWYSDWMAPPTALIRSRKILVLCACMS